MGKIRGRGRYAGGRRERPPLSAGGSQNDGASDLVSDQVSDQVSD